MNALSLIFQLGVLFSAFAFIWFWLQLLLMIILPENIRTQFRYFLQLLQSLFLGVLVLKFVANVEGSLTVNSMLILSLITYFLYLSRNIRSEQNAVQVQLYTNLYKKVKMKNEWELAVALISISITILWVFFPVALDSVVTQWFYEQTQDLIKIPIIGWIFKLAGFFFLLATLVRFLAAIMWMLRGPKSKAPMSDADKFDDFEEIK
ncbi:MAG: hypothetical protein RL365_923 [Bacteroidota bacterium]|jgi:hypothetical protein